MVKNVEIIETIKFIKIEKIKNIKTNKDGKDGKDDLGKPSPAGWWLSITTQSYNTNCIFASFSRNIFQDKCNFLNTTAPNPGPTTQNPSSKSTGPLTPYL